MKRIDGLSFTDPTADPIGSFRETGFVEAIHHSDNMNRPGMEQLYFWTGRTALDCIQAVAPERKFANILDFPSGYGRVMRFLRAAYPGSRIVACDIDPNSIGFCERSFDALPVISREAIDEVSLEGSFDLIWVGSLFTHLDESSANSLLKLCASLLEYEGVLVFSIAGKYVSDLAEAGDHGGVSMETIREMISEFKRHGFAFGSYSPGVVFEKNYGRAFIDLSWLEKKRTELELESVAYIDRGYGRRQDVVIWRKA